MFELSRTSTVPLVDQIVERLTRLVRHGQLPNGARIPSIRQLAERLVQRGIACGPANIVTTFGASQAFDLIARILFAPGDTVLVEDPGYFVLFEQLRAHHVKLVSIPRRSNGPDIDALEAACR